MNPHYTSVAQRAGHRCEYCHATEAVFNFAFEVERVKPSSRSGDDSDENLALACRACNVRKSARLTTVDPETKMEVPIFHPRTYVWDEHFRVDQASGRIDGLTPVGRAAVQCLAMNSEAQLVARLQWMRLGLFP